MNQHRWFGLLAFLLLPACFGGDEQNDAPSRAAQEIRDATQDEPTLVELALHSLPDESGSTELLAANTPTVYEVFDRLHELEERDDVKGVFLRVSPLGGGWGRIADIGAEIARIKTAKHWPVHCHFDVADNASYAFMARVCDRITMTPGGDLELVGVAGQVFHAKRLLDSIGVQADILHVGRYKSAAEPLTRESISPETRESLGTLLNDIEDVLVNTVATSRHMDASAVRTAIDAAPHDSATALQAHLVDHVAYDDEARRVAKEQSNAKRVQRVRWLDAPEELSLSAVLDAFSGTEHAGHRTDKRIALVILSDEIRDGEEERQGAGTSSPFVRHLRKLGDDANVKAVVLRINSPGGSALASDRMWHAVRRVAARKPVYVSVGDMAASGGYYIASGAQEIYASPASIVGSIGVVGGKINLGGLLDRIGVNTEIIATAANAGWSSATCGFSDSERAIVQRMMQTTYERFVDRVSTGRNMPTERVLAAAEGRVWSAQRGHGLGLVNQLDLSYADVLRRARTHGAVEQDVDLDVWPRKRSFLETLAESMQPEGNEQAQAQLVGLVLRSVGAEGLAIERALRIARAWLDGEHVRMDLPFSLEIR